VDEWVVLSLVSAFALATSDALTKKALGSYDEYLIAWLRLVCALPLLVAALCFVPIPPLDRDFFLASLTALPLEIIALILYVKALRASPLSLTLPFLALTPLFLIVVPHVVLGEEVSHLAALGVCLIAAGSYTLNVRLAWRGLLEPLRAIGRERGSLFMIGVALIYAFTSTLGKKAITHSSALFFAAAYFIALTAAFTPVALLKTGMPLRRILSGGPLMASIMPGICYGVMILSHMWAMSLTNVAYMISVKRVSLLIGVLYGIVFFGESGVKERLAGAILMLTGFVLIVLYH
jgi:drug/metabolite transporter (DMT)-like permease